jgi:hypothetical protein
MHHTTYIGLQFTKLKQNLKENTGCIETLGCVPGKQNRKI